MSSVSAFARQKHQGSRIRVRGLVQGVGFRPTVWRLATDCGLSGEVLNDSDGVLIRAWGNSGAIDVFVRRLKAEAPPLARIDTIERGPLRGRCSEDGFRIAASAYGEVHTGSRSRFRHLPRVRGRDIAAAEPPVPLSFHELHSLRPTPVHRERNSLRQG